MPNPSNHLDESPGILNGRADQDEIDLLEYWRILVERKNIALVCLGVTFVLVALFTFLTTPTFESITTLQIERQGPDILTFQDVLGVDQAGYKDYYQTQYKIIQSKSVLRLAAERIDLVNNPEYLSRKGTPVGRLYRWTRALIMGAPEEPDPLDKAVKFIEKDLSIRPIRNSHLVQIAFMDRNAVLSSDIANAVADAYQQFSRESRFTTTEEASDFLTKQVARLQGEIIELERKLQEMGSEKEILALSDGTQDISEQALADLNARLSQARAHLATSHARYESVQESTPDSLPEVLNSTLINNLKQDYAELERKYTLMAERFKPDWPALQELKGELDKADERLQTETAFIVHKVKEAARSDYEQAKAEVARLDEEVEGQKLVVKKVSSDAIEYAGLRAEIQTRRNVLNDLVTRQSQTQASEQLHDTSASNIRVVDRAEVPDEPARPRKALNLFLALLVGSGLGIAMAFLMHYLDNTIKTEQDIERYASGAVAVLGHVPLLEQIREAYGIRKRGNGKEDEEDGAPSLDPDFASHHEPRSSFAEAFKNLRTSLLLASPDHPPRSISVTSCEPSDGKSTIAINLAIVLTQMGRKVLLVDADLRRPRLYKTFGLDKNVGLSSVLSGNAELHDAVHETHVPNLSVITSGPIPPNPSELLDSPAFSTFRSALEQYGFEHILFDCPPSIQVADSLIISTKVDATILVVRAGSTSRDSLSQGTARLLQTRAHLAGAVLNAIPERGKYYYYRRYRYYRKYYAVESDSTTVSVSEGASKKKKRRLHAHHG